MSPQSTQLIELDLSIEINDRWIQQITAEEDQFEEKGGPGSGHHGHGGRPGKRGGSSSGRLSLAEVDVVSFGAKDVTSQLHQEIGSWGGRRRDVGVAALEEVEEEFGTSGVLFKHEGEIVGVAAYAEGDFVVLEYLATKRPGVGRTAMAAISKVVIDSDALGLQLFSAADATGFYDKLGMSAEGLIYSWTSEEASAFVALSQKALIDDEPKDGVFTVPSKRRKGGPGSGHHGHAGRPGSRGGSASIGGAAHADVEKKLGFNGFSGGMKERAVTLVASLPQEHLAHVAQIQALTPLGITQTIGPGHTRDAGIYSTHLYTPFVTLNKNARTVGDLSTSLQKKTLAHEVGHSVHHKLDAKKYGSAAHVRAAQEYGDSLMTGDLTRAQFTRKLNTMYGQVKRGKRSSVTEYAKADVREWFSESYGHYVTQPGKLRAADSEVYGLLKANLFGGKEYGS